MSAYTPTQPPPIIQAPAQASHPGLPSFTTRRMLRDFVIVLSLVNLAYLRVWSELLTATPADFFFLKHPFVPGDYMAAISSVFAIAVMSWTAVILTRRYTRGAIYQFCRLAFCILAVAGPGIALRHVVLHANTPGRIFGAHSHAFPWLANAMSAFETLVTTRNSRVVVAGIAILALALAVRLRSQLVRLVTLSLLCGSPFVAVTFLQASYLAVTLPRISATDLPTASFFAGSPSQRVIWIVFDEWDYRLTFVDRDPALRLPALDGLRNASLFANHALPPAGQTPLSMPSFVDGRRVTASTPASADILRITYLDNNRTVTWGSQPNVFTKARAMGVNTGVLGWFLPYCRLFSSSLASCAWTARAIPANTTGATLLEKMIRQPRSALETTLLSPFGQSLSAQQHIKDYNQMDAALRDLSADSRLGLVFAHIPAPHSPFVYDRRTNTFSRKNDLVRGYIDELSLVDRTVAGVRAVLERKGEWNSTVLLLTADHPFRDSAALDGKSDPRVPFILKMRGQRSGFSLDCQFNNVISGEFLLAILRGEVSTPEQAAKWIREQSGRPAWN